MINELSNEQLPTTGKLLEVSMTEKKEKSLFDEFFSNIELNVVGGAEFTDREILEAQIFLMQQHLHKSLLRKTDFMAVANLDVFKNWPMGLKKLLTFYSEKMGEKFFIVKSSLPPSLFKRSKPQFALFRTPSYSTQYTFQGASESVTKTFKLARSLYEDAAFRHFY